MKITRFFRNEILGVFKKEQPAIRSNAIALLQKPALQNSITATIRVKFETSHRFNNILNIRKLM